MSGHQKFSVWKQWREQRSFVLYSNSFLMLISTSTIYSVLNKQQIRRIKAQQFIEVLILILSLALIKKFWSTVFLLMQWYGQHQYYDIYIFNDVLNEKMQSQKDLPWIWSVCLELELLPSDVLESARATEEKMPSSLIQREE